MKDLSDISDDELKTELDLRAKGRQSKAPEPLKDPDFLPLHNMVVEGVERSIAAGYEDEDFKHYVYEAAMQAVYGKDYWIWRNAQKW